MNLVQLFFWPFLASLLAAIAAGMIFAATKTISRGIVRWKTSRFPKSVDADRVKEELDAMLNEMRATERAELTVNLLANSRALHQEITERAAASLPADSDEISTRTASFKTLRLSINKARLLINQVIENNRTLREGFLANRAHVAAIERALEQRGWPVALKINPHNAASAKLGLADLAEKHSHLLGVMANTNRLSEELPRSFVVRAILPEYRKLLRERAELKRVYEQEAETNTRIRHILQTFQDY